MITAKQVAAEINALVPQNETDPLGYAQQRISGRIQPLKDRGSFKDRTPCHCRRQQRYLRAKRGQNRRTDTARYITC